MEHPSGFNRRDLLRALAGVALAAHLPARADAPAATNVHTSKEDTSWETRSSDGVRLVGDVRGPADAPEIVFVHGLRQSRLSWQRQWSAPQLQSLRMMRFDLRGHGDSDKPDEPARYANLDLWADDLAAALDAAQMRRPMLVGWSLGAWAIGGFLRRYPNRPVQALNLVSGVLKFSPGLLTPLAGQFARSTSSANLAERAAASVEFLRACFAQPPAQAELERMLLVNGMTPRAVNLGLTQPGAPDLDATWKSFAGPVLLTHGGRDQLVQLAMSQHFRRLNPKAQLSLYPRSGHSAFFEEPARFNRELLALVHTR